MITIRDLLCGVAVGDAIGYPLEFIRNPNKKDFEASVSAEVLQASDDTQMTLFLAETIAKHGTSFNPETPYTRWYITQTRFKGFSGSEDGLLTFDYLYHLRVPGNTCMSACESLSHGEKVVNDSKGNGTVMRISPWALKAALDKEAEYSHYIPFVVKDSLTTHKHAEAAESAVALFLLLYRALHGVNIRSALELVAREIDPNSRTSELLLKAMRGKEIDVEGWVAEEALYIAVVSVLNSKHYLDAVYNASVISSDSDTCASIAGAIAVCYGMKPPEDLIAKLDLLPAIEYISGIWRN